MPFKLKCKMFIFNWFFVFFVLFVSFWGQYYFSNVEKDYNNYKRSDCIG